MKKADIIKVYSAEEMDRTRGQVVLVRTDEPVTYGGPYDEENQRTHYLYVSAARVGRDDEVYIFPATEEGTVLDWLELPGSRRGTISIRMTMMDAGYDISAWPEEVV